MTKKIRSIKTAMVPIGVGTEGENALALAHSVAETVIVVGVVTVDDENEVGESMVDARKIRKRLLSLGRDANTRFKASVIASSEPWHDLQKVIRDEEPDILITEWENGYTSWGEPISTILMNPVCDIAIIHGELPEPPRRVMVTVRGGPYAELALQVGMGLEAQDLDMLHININGANTDAPFVGMQNIVKHLPEVNLRRVVGDDVSRVIAEEVKGYNVIVLGATASRAVSASTLGPIAEQLLNDPSTTAIIVKSRRQMNEHVLDESVGEKAISVLVNKWFRENTFHANEFADLELLMDLKEKQGSTISLALPALNEEETVGKVVDTIRSALMQAVPLLDEIVLIDSNSTDRTREIAKEMGLPVHIHQQILPNYGARRGKGEALWKSLLVTKGDIIAWIDTDIMNIHPRFVYGIIGPLLFNRNIQLVKGFYRRPLRVGDQIQAGGGGRVTELTARPLLNLFYPELSGIIQPLSGEYAGRREALERATFFSGYGVETGLIIDIFEQFGLGAIAQVDLLERIHHNQELEALGKMSFAIIQTVLRKLEPRFERSFIKDINKTMKIPKYNKGHYDLAVEQVAERERPPIITIPEYNEVHKKVTRLCLVRHGQTDWNLEGRYQGQSDVPLNDNGNEQARSLVEKLRGKNFSAIYTSDLSRARETAEPIAKALNIPLRVEPRLREINQGEWEGQLVDDLKTRYTELWEKRAVDPANVRPPGGETVGEVAERVYAALNDVARQFPTGNVLIVSHGLSIATAICRSKNIPVGQAYTVIPDNVRPVWMDWKLD
ncbi:MAG: glucosyl-3-phosphoglycerate synthase [Anaerolineales bacterium]|nr:glucosyl-3-phosphoglycerate synthase [Anaerolineales bacterium]